MILNVSLSDLNPSNIIQRMKTKDTLGYIVMVMACILPKNSLVSIYGFSGRWTPHILITDERDGFW